MINRYYLPDQMDIAVPPEVLFLSLSTRSLQNYSAILSDIPKHFILNQIHEAHDALEVLRTSHPRAVIITDEEIAKDANCALLEQVAKYAKDGGLVIIAGYWFANNVSFDYSGDPKPFFDLPWEAGFCHTYSLWKLNENCSVPDDSEAAVAGARVRNGYLVYIGDTNWDFGSERIMMGFLGVRSS
ncbi:hypothetical protein BJX66DRAFT_336962 [Aspergillus keveii]|uniref:Uncharacterized protein n=1 Tax=Aspergillus keveii TaxID=714993 RepID=A0ABR4G8Q5_9EURO